MEQLDPYYQEKEKRCYKDLKCLWFVIKITVIALVLFFAAKGAFGDIKTRSYKANVSAYCLCEKCCGKWAKVLPRKTASGHLIKPGDKFVAAPKNIPFGTWLDIPGYGKVQVLDRGGAIKGNKLDVYFSTHKEALKWGRKYLIVEEYK